METPIRSVRLSDDLWEQMREMAKKENKNISDILREILFESLLEGKITRREK